MEVPDDIEAKHCATIGLTEDGCRKVYVPDQIKADEDTRRVAFTISTGALDRDNDTIKVDGWDVKNYLKNPVVLFAHRADMLPVAKAVSVVKTAGALKATAEFPPAGQYPLADTVYDFLKGGFLRATSVGFRPKRDKDGRPRMAWNEERGGIDFEEQELLEFSVVPVPSNPQALMEQAKDFAGGLASGIDLAPIRKALDLADVAVATAPVAAGQTQAPEPDPKPVEKAGRRLSSKTEASLRSAHKSASEAVEHLNAVLGKAEDEMDDCEDEDMPKSAPIAPVAVEPQKVLYVIPEPKYLVPLEQAGQVIEAAVKRAVSSAINRAKGRLD